MLSHLSLQSQKLLQLQHNHQIFHGSSNSAWSDYNSGSELSLVELVVTCEVASDWELLIDGG